MQPPSKKAIIAFFILIVLVHAAGLSYRWYHELWWIDILMHTAGGVWVAMAAWYVYQRTVPELGRQVPPWLHLIFILGAVMLIGVIWEWMEYVFDALFFPKKFVFRAQLGLTDTMGDLLADFSGGLAYACYRVFIKKIRNHG